MRKRNIRHKRSWSKGQGNLFETGNRSTQLAADGGTVREREGLAEMLSRLTNQLASTEHLLEEIVSIENIGKAYQEVKSNAGAAGVDGMDIERTGAWLREHLSTLQEEVLEGQYQVQPVRKVEIPKPNGGVRTLGIPTVKDRVLQQAVHRVLSRYYEPHFSEHSYGFRPGRGAQDAISRAASYVREGYEWVVDIDLEKFFDKINHDRLMSRLKKGIGDKRLLRLINDYLKAGMMSEGLMEQRTAGTPQGGPLSPLLSNIVLDELDRELERKGYKFCRYADDCNIYVESEEAGRAVMLWAVQFIEGKLKLRVNRDKSEVRHCTGVKFLGYTLTQTGGIRVADKSDERFKDKLRKLCKRNRGVKFEQVIREVNEAIKGWSGYFRKANAWLGDYRHMDSWLRRKLRCYRLKESGRKYSIYKLLCNLGAESRESWNVVMYSQGWWAMSNKRTVNKAMSNDWFARQGLRSIYSEMTRKKY
jgi:RNA-directed DNA polymerase